MALHASSTSLLASEISENEENASPNFELKSPEMKTVPTLVQNMYPSLKNTQEKESNTTGTTGPMSTRSPIRTAKRRGLATLQQSAAGKGSVVGGLRNESMFTDHQKRKKSGTVFSWTVQKDASPSTPKCKHPSLPATTTSSSSTQTDSDDWLKIGEIPEKDNLAEEALALLRSEPSQEQYFKEIAEERRLALEETLKENEELFDEVDVLKEKCEKLEKALSEAENYKLLYLAMLESKTSCECVENQS